MKEIYILRHAQANDKTSGQGDVDRKLSEHGKVQAKELGKELLTFPAPDLILCSHSQRTQETYDIVKANSNWQSTFKIDRAIYHGYVEDYIEIIKSVDSSVNRLLLIGHNPSISALCRFLLKGAESLDTCGFYAISLKINDWSEIMPNIGKEITFIQPN